MKGLAPPLSPIEVHSALRVGEGHVRTAFGGEAEAPRIGDELDLGRLYHLHAHRVARWAWRLGGPWIDVEDVLHDVFIVVERKRKTFRRDSLITTWLYGITANVVRYERRKARLRRYFFSDSRWINDVASLARTPAEELERSEAARVVYAVLDRLREKYRSVLILHEIEGLNGPEIAELMGVKPSTVWVRLHRARAMFKTELERMRERSP